jgi:small GTP-binding protein
VEPLLLALVFLLLAAALAGGAVVLFRRKGGAAAARSLAQPNVAEAAPAAPMPPAQPPATDEPVGPPGRKGPEDMAHPVPLGVTACSKKVALIGDGGVGKTSLINRFVKGSFDDKYMHTIGTNVKKKSVLLHEEKAEVTMMVWDMQGQRNDPAILTHMFRSEGAIVVCDVTRDQTFNSIPEWISLLEEELGGRVPMVILGNKADLEEQALIGQPQLQYMAARLGASYYLTSAKTGEGVEQAFTELARMMMKKDKGNGQQG